MKKTNDAVSEKQFEEMRDLYESRKRTKSDHTGVQKVVQVMYDEYLYRKTNRIEKIWWWSYEFVGRVNSKGDFLSHRAPARASDLAIHFPELVEDRKIGRLSVYRLRVENMEEITKFLNSRE
jgi:hypothetical protein